MATLTTSYQKLGTISISTYSQLRIYGKYNSQSTSGNTSNISIQLRLYGNGGSGSFSSGSCGISGIYNHTSGTTSYSTNLGSTSYSKGSEKTLATYTYSVNHSATGTYSDTITYKISSSGSVSGSGSVNFSLPTIPRASQPSVLYTGFELGMTQTIYTNRASSSFTHTLTYSFGNSTGTIATGVGASVDWTPPSSLINEFSSTESSKTCTITCITYSGSTNIGTKTTSFTISVPATSSPTYSNFSKEETDTDVINAIGSSMTKAILRLSKPRYQMTLASHDGATLSRVAIKCGDLTNTINLSGTSYNFDYTFQNAMTSNIVTFSIIDSRGYSMQFDDEYDSYETYTPITLTSQLVKRTDLSGTTRATFEGTMQPDNIDGVTGNGIYASYRYKETGGNWSNLYDFNVTYDDNTNRTKWYVDETLVLTALYNKSYTIELQVTDANVSTPLVYTYTINKAVPTMSLGENDMQVNGDLFVSGTSQIQNGLYCRPTGQVNTPVGNSMLVIKRATNSEAPNNGVVLEFGYSTNWTGQLFIGDNATQGIYYNGWSNGVRGSWIKLASQNDLAKNIITMQLTGSQSFGNAYTKLNLSARTTIGTKLSVSSNQVRIGSGVNHIKVSATFGYNYTNAGMRYLRITKNFNTSSIDTTTIALQQKYENNTNHVGTLAITDVVISVSEGDLIGMYVYGLNGDSVRYTTSGMIQTNMTIEVID